MNRIWRRLMERLKRRAWGDAFWQRRRHPRAKQPCFESRTMTMADRDGLIWYDGELVPWREANTHRIDLTPPALRHGCVRRGSGLCPRRGALIFPCRPIPTSCFVPPISWACRCRTAKRKSTTPAGRSGARNNLASAYIRPMCFFGAEGMGLRERPQGPRHRRCLGMGRLSGRGKPGTRHPYPHLVVQPASCQHRHVAKAKANGNYMNSMLALSEALRDGYDEALLLDTEVTWRRVAARTSFIVRDGLIHTRIDVGAGRHHP